MAGFITAKTEVCFIVTMDKISLNRFSFRRRGSPKKEKGHHQDNIPEYDEFSMFKYIRYFNLV